MSSLFDLNTFLNDLPCLPGIYQMLDHCGTTIYVGKANSLKSRVSSYFKSTVGGKTRVLVEQVAKIEITVTHSEAEALLLESNLIKQLVPRYNILLRDDKSYPYIYISTQDNFPRIELFRGKKMSSRAGRFFGPFPSVQAVKETLALLQKVFLLRTCKNSYFNHRTRPCLQFQIGRCSAPCVQQIERDKYNEQINLAIELLDGKGSQLIERLEAKMQSAASLQNFEQAAGYRDQIKQLRQVQAEQSVIRQQGDADVLAAHYDKGQTVIARLSVRGGQVLAVDSFFPSLPVNSLDSDWEHVTPDSIMQASLLAFISQYYLTQPTRLPDCLIATLNEAKLIKQTIKRCRSSSKLIVRPKGDQVQWLALAKSNAISSLKAKLSSKASMHARFVSLQHALELETQPVRLECFDISHTSGENTVGSCVVFNQEGPLKSDYRLFNIKGITAGDDYAAMKQVLLRRYQRIKKNDGPWPSIVFIDGGKGQVSQAKAVFSLLDIRHVPIVGIAKGPTRKAGLETLIISANGRELHLDDDSSALHLIQYIRDESHRFAIGGHRQRRGKARTQSVLEDIDGVGSKRKSALLRYFGGLKGLLLASVQDIQKVNGISLSLAKKIYQQLHPE